MVLKIEIWKAVADRACRFGRPLDAVASIHRLSTAFHVPSGRSAPMTGSANDATRSRTVENSAGTLDSINLMIRFRYLLVRITQGRRHSCRFLSPRVGGVQE